MHRRLEERIGAVVQEGVPLREHTTLCIGGPARYLCDVDSAVTLLAAFEAARAEGLEALVLGEGSNVLVLDGGFDGLVIRNRMRGLERDGECVDVASGESFHGLIERLAGWGLAGLEFAAGVPGTVGGAVFGNAGCYGRAIGGVVEQVRLVGTDGVQRSCGPEALDFRYRHSALRRSGEIVESVRLRLEPGDPAILRQTIDEHLAVRSSKHPSREVPSAGSWFRNLDPREPGGRRVAAGQMLDQVGCKGLRVGDAAVFEGHANIVINRGNATAGEILELTREMKLRVRGRFGVDLVEEVRQIGHPVPR
jgi:UDP-N-acetylmuramate dehydrogenase